MLKLITKAQKLLGENFKKEFEKWQKENCPQVIGGNGIGDCNCCPYPVCIEFFKKIVENKNDSIVKNKKGQIIGVKRFRTL